MAWRIAPQIVRGEIDNRIKGYVTGKLWIWGQPEPLSLHLCGHPAADLAGRKMELFNPKPDDSTEVVGLAAAQKGVLGDLTAARMIRTPLMSLDQILHSRGKFPYQWDSAFYFEWFSESNGRIVIETTEFEVQCSEPSWTLTAEDAAAQDHLNATAWQAFMRSLADGLNQFNPERTPELGPGFEEEEAIEQLLRINELKHQLDCLSGGQMVHGSMGPLPLEVEEQFWKNVLEFEKSPQIKRKDILFENDSPPLPAELLDDDQLTDALWKLIHALAEHSMFLECTDHLSDRELYTLLLERVLEETATALRPDSGWVNHICMEEYGTVSEDGTDIFLKYYADVEFRRRWAEEFNEALPPHEDPPYDRDRHLPQPDR